MVEEVERTRVDAKNEEKGAAGEEDLQDDELPAVFIFLLSKRRRQHTESQISLRAVKTLSTCEHGKREDSQPRRFLPRCRAR